jgi:Rab GDP dissociation inhibitor
LAWTDIYIACVSSAHNVCPKGYWIAIVSTIAETSANHHLELAPGIERLGRIEEQFMVRDEDAFEPTRGVHSVFADKLHRIGPSHPAL